MMTRIAIVEDGIVTNVILADADFPDGIACGADVRVGDHYDGSAFVPVDVELTPDLPTFEAAIQAHLDCMARERSYDSIQTAVTYRDDPNPVFAAEASALFTWRSEVWTYAYAELAKVEAGERDVPTVEAFIGELPAMVWPE